MDGGRSQYEGRPEAGTSRETCSQVNQRQQSTTAHHCRRLVSVQNCPVYLSLAPAARSDLGSKEILRHMRTPPRSTSSSIRRPLTEAVILMAGLGTRLRGSSDAFLKPMGSVGGRPLVWSSISALADAGIKIINAVVGFESARLTAAVRRLIPPEISVRFIENPDWQKMNGISLLTAARAVTPPFLLTMSDHLFEPAIIDLVIKSADFSQLNLAVDRKLNTIFDLEDAMKVQTRGDHVIEIGKNLPNYDAIDTGLFVCPADIFKYLEKAKQAGDCSLNDGVRLMAADHRARAFDIGDAWWQDVDTPDMLRHAEERMRIAG